MARYGTFKYGTDVYGNLLSTIGTSNLAALVLDYDRVRLTVLAKDNKDKPYTIVRHKVGYAEDPTKGITIDSGVLTDVEFTLVDSEVNTGVPLSRGSMFYSLFVYETNGIWLTAARDVALVPQDMGSVDKTLDLFPRMYTSEDNNPLSPIDHDSQFSRFITGFGITYDVWNSQGKFLMPYESEVSVSGPLTEARARSAGVLTNNLEVNIGSNYRLHREASFITRYKGTELGIATYSESLTGWDSNLFMSANLMLNNDDSSFETSVGNWGAVSNATITRVETNGSTIVAPTKSNEDPDNPFGAVALGQMTISSTSGSISTESDTDGRMCGVPVLESTDYYLRVPVQAETGTPTLVSYVTWYDKRGASISTSTSGGSTVTSGSWQNSDHVVTSPSGAAYATFTLSLSGSSSDSVYVDMIEFVQSDTVGDYYDARAVDIVLSPNRINLCTNPSFEIGTTGWAVMQTTLSRVTSEHNIGLAAGQLVADVDNTESGVVWSTSIPAAPNLLYTVSMYVKCDSGSADFRAFFHTGEAGYGNIYEDTFSAVFTTFGDVTTVDDTDWVRVHVTGLTPSSTTEMIYGVATTASVADGFTWYIDNILVESASGPQVYFDGSLNNEIFSDAVWQADVHDSRSLLYNQRAFKLAVLRLNLPEYMVDGQPYRVLTWDSPEPYVQDLGNV